MYFTFIPYFIQNKHVPHTINSASPPEGQRRPRGARPTVWDCLQVVLPEDGSRMSSRKFLFYFWIDRWLKSRKAAILIVIHHRWAVPWLRRLVAGLSPGRPGSHPNQSMWDLWWTEWYWDRFSSEFFGFPLSVSFHRRSNSSAGRWTVCPLVAAVQRRSLTPSK
jgi:hypothetical protein